MTGRSNGSRRSPSPPPGGVAAARRGRRGEGDPRRRAGGADAGPRGAARAARGLHPNVLTDRGLGPALEALVLRSPIPVEIDVPDERFPPAIEAAAYYVTAEALANVAKYAEASVAEVRIAEEDDGAIVIEVVDDGVGGADPARGSGLEGLVDRVESLDGAFAVESPTGGGTRVRATIRPPRASAALSR